MHDLLGPDQALGAESEADAPPISDPLEVAVKKKLEARPFFLLFLEA